MPRPRPVVRPVDAPETPTALAAAGGLDITAAAEFLGLGRTRVKELVKSGELAHYRDGGKVMIPRRALQLRIESLLEQQQSARS